MTTYNQGFLDMCKQAGVDPELVKNAKPGSVGNMQLNLDADSPKDLGVYAKHTGTNMAGLALPLGVGDEAMTGASVGGIFGALAGHPLLEILKSPKSTMANMMTDADTIGRVGKDYLAELPGGIKNVLKSGQLSELLQGLSKSFAKNKPALQALMKRRVYGAGKGALLGAAALGGLKAMSNAAEYGWGNLLAPEANELDDPTKTAMPVYEQGFRMMCKQAEVDPDELLKQAGGVLGLASNTLGRVTKVAPKIGLMKEAPTWFNTLARTSPKLVRGGRWAARNWKPLAGGAALLGTGYGLGGGFDSQEPVPQGGGIPPELLYALMSRATGTGPRMGGGTTVNIGGGSGGGYPAQRFKTYGPTAHIPYYLAAQGLG